MSLTQQQKDSWKGFRERKPFILLSRFSSKHKALPGKSMRWLMRATGWLCLSLMVWMAAVESSHNHATRTESASCSICIVAHSASPAPSSAHAAPVFAAVGVLHEEAVVVNAQPEFSDLDIRGPPVLL